MDLLSLYKAYSESRDDGILLSFKGLITEDIINELGEMIKTSLSEETKVKKIFAVFIELSQNILRYSFEKSKDGLGIGIISLRKIDNYYIIASGNMISKETANKIKEKISLINSLNKDELKELYQKTLRLPLAETSRGAGLGLIDIAKRSESKIDFEIEEIENSKLFLTLGVSFFKEK
jgi:hypothetical protein